MVTKEIPVMWMLLNEPEDFSDILQISTGIELKATHYHA